jgi:hypothetical protein
MRVTYGHPLPNPPPSGLIPALKAPGESVRQTKSNWFDSAVGTIPDGIEPMGRKPDGLQGKGIGEERFLYFPRPLARLRRACLRGAGRGGGG